MAARHRFGSTGVGRLVAMAVVSVGLQATSSAALTGSCLNHFGVVPESEQLVPTVDDANDRDGGYDPTNGNIITGTTIPVIVPEAPIYRDPSRSSSQIGTLAFSERTNPQRIVGDFVLLGKDPRYRQDVLGWVHAGDLLCRTTPLRSDIGVSRKFYIKTAANFADEEDSIIEPKAGPTTTACAKVNGECQRLTRFSRFYIFAEDPMSGRLLLMGRNISESDTPLTGWVDAETGYKWNSRIGMRPADNLMVNASSGILEAGPELRACLYPTLDDAEGSNEEFCETPILGGPRWFNSSVRIPVLDRVNHNGTDYLHVALPIAGVGEDSRDALLSQVAGLDAAIAELRSLKNLDVFFLIDGTESMKNHIPALLGNNTTPGLITSIQDTLDNKEELRTVSIRYGYRVYRDTYVGGNFWGVGEGLRMDNNCAPTEADLSANREAFQAGIAAIDTSLGTDSGIPDPDHEENMALGLAFAVDDMAPCPDNVKLLFVIGDTGFDPERLVKNGVPITREAEIVDLFKNSTARAVDPIIPFFIQLPRQALGDSYDTAYDRFAEQGQSLILKIMRAYNEDLNQTKIERPEEHFFSLDGQELERSQQALINDILDRVVNFGDQRPVNQIIASLQTGESLVQIIEALQDEASGVPALRLSQIEGRVCDKLGAACTQRIVSDVAEGYIAHDDKVVLDVLLEGDEFDGWRSQLDTLRNTDNISPLKRAQLIVNNMVTGVEKSLGELSPAEMDLSLGEFLALKVGLPTASDTPLLSYSVRDFVAVASAQDIESAFDFSQVEFCEFVAVATWLERHRSIFDSVYRSTVPIFDKDTRVSDCDMRSNSLRVLTLDDDRPFPDPNTMSFRKIVMDTTQYWLPEAYLP